MTRSHAIIWINFPIIEIIVYFWAAGRRTLPQLLHCQSLHNDYKGPGEHQANVDCIRAALTVSVWTQLIQLLPIIAIIWTIIVIILKRRIAIWLGINEQTFQDQQAITHYLPRPSLPVQAQDHAELHQQSRSSWCKLAIPFAWPDGTYHQDHQPFKQLQHVCPPKCDQEDRDQRVPFKNFNKHNNSNNLKRHNNVNNHNNDNNTCAPCYSVLKPQFQKMSTIMCTIPLFKTCIFLTNRPFADNLNICDTKQNSTCPQTA